MKTMFATLTILATTTCSSYCKSGGWLWDLIDRGSNAHNTQCRQQAGYYYQPVYYTQPRTVVYYNNPVYCTPAPSLYQPQLHRPNTNRRHCR